MNYFNYFTEIEETFIRRRGSNLLLSPLDWALIETWQEREIPLHIILRGIERVFDTVDKQTTRKRTVKSLVYCKEEIEAQYAEWLESQIGKTGFSGTDTNLKPQDSNFPSKEIHSAKSELFSDDAIKNHLESTISDLEIVKENADGDLRETFERVLNRLTELEKNYQSAETLEESLEKLDALIDESILKHFETKGLKEEIEKQLASYSSKMEPEVYRRTLDLMLLKRLRETAEIPRLSLFYL